MRVQAALTNKSNKNQIKIYKKGASTNYKGTLYRSRFEVYVKILLEHSNIPHAYEPQRFWYGRTLSYLPDFQLLDGSGIWLEVKGLLSERDKILMNHFSRENKLFYLGKEQLKSVHGRKNITELSSPNIPLYVPSKAELRRFKRFLRGKLA